MPSRVPTRSAPSPALALLALACACNDGPRVPFKLDAGRPPSAPAPEAPTSPLVVSYPQAVDEPVLEGARLPLPAVRATLLHDLDGDDDRDAIALVHDPLAKLRLMLARRGPAGFADAVEVPGLVLPADPTCTLARAALSALAADKGLLELAFLCGEERTALPPELHVFSLESAPRVLLRLGERSALPGEPPLGLGVQAVAGDDGRSDVVITSALAPAFRFPLRDRASGLSRDLDEPETSFAAEAKLADAALAKDPAAAEARAASALTAFEALCREADAPRLLAGGEPGLSCGKSASHLKLLVTSALARLRAKDLGGALARYRAALGAGLTPGTKPHDRVATAFAKLASKSARVVRLVPALSPSALPPLHVPAVRFADEDMLVLGFGSPRTLQIGSGEEAALPSAIDPLVRDPSGNLAAVALARSCAGLQLKLARVPRGEGAYAAREHVGSVLVVPSGLSEDCKGSPVEVPAGALTLLGWAPQGIVAAHGDAIWVAPISAEGQPLGPPFQIAPDAARPAPLTTGVSTRDGGWFAEVLPIGVVLHGPDARHVELLAPSALAGLAPGAREAALSPSGSTVALVAGTDVVVIAR